MQEKYERHLTHMQSYILGDKISALKNNQFLIFLACLIWLIIRSGRKPNRLAYPCQRAAAITVTTYLTMVFLLLRHWISSYIRLKVAPKTAITAALIISASSLFIVNAVQKLQVSRSWEEYALTKTTNPVGIRINSRDPKKLFFQTIPAAMLLDSPHRVISMHSSNATNWTGTENPHLCINQEEVSRMVRRGILLLTMESDYAAAWRKLITYNDGEAVAIKLNFNNAGSWTADPAMNPYAELVNAVIDGLVGIGVPANKIWLVDPSRVINDVFRERITNKEVLFYTNSSPGGRPRVVQTTYVAVDSPYASYFQSSEDGLVAVRIAQVFVDAAHIINVPQLKGHGGANITLGIKNHYGSAILGTQGRSYWHKYFYLGGAAYNSGLDPLVEINLNPQLLNKTRLTIGDGLYGNPTTNGGSMPPRWISFNNTNPEILFFGVDPVAVDSVMFDYLQRECAMRRYSARNDNVLRKAATAGLGVFEHWNNDTDMRYAAIDYAKVDFDTILYGDVSGDAEVSAYDAALTAQAAVGLITLSAEQAQKADVNGDGEVSAYDAALIAQRAVGLIDKFPVE